MCGERTETAAAARPAPQESLCVIMQYLNLTVISQGAAVAMRKAENEAYRGMYTKYTLHVMLHPGRALTNRTEFFAVHLYSFSDAGKLMF